MAFLDTTLKVIRLLSALVWLGVGIVTLWGTWITFKDLGPYLRTLTAVVSGTDPSSGSPKLPGGVSLQDIQGLLRSPKTER